VAPRVDRVHRANHNLRSLDLELRKASLHPTPVETQPTLA
jgi:hypothetical protein